MTRKGSSKSVTHKALAQNAPLKKGRLSLFARNLSLDALPDVLVVIGILIYSLFFSIYLIQKFEDFRTGYFDFGLSVQSVWLVTKGDLNGLALGRPITILAGLLYAVYPQPQTLLSLQSYTLGVGALPLYLLAKRELQSKWSAIAVSGLYLLSPVLWGINQYEFHDLAFSVPFLLSAVYFYRTRRIWFYIASVALALCSSPFVVVIAIAMIASFMADSRISGKPRSNVAFTLGTLIPAAVFIIYLQMIPLLSSYQLPTVGTQSYTFVGSTSYLHPLAVVNDPIGSIGYLWPQKVLYFSTVLAPVLLLPFLSMRGFLPALPWVGIVVVYTPAFGAGGVGPPFELSQWSSFLVPFVFAATVYGFKRASTSTTLVRIGFAKTRTVLLIMILLTLLTATLESGLSPIGASTQFSGGDSSVPTDVPPGQIFHGIWPTPVKDAAILDWFIQQIPINYSVLTQNQIGSKLGERTVPVYIFYQPGYKDVFADAILVDNNLSGLCASCLNNILSSGNYTIHLSYSEGEIYLFYKIP